MDVRSGTPPVARHPEAPGPIEATPSSVVLNPLLGTVGLLCSGRVVSSRIANTPVPTLRRRSTGC